MPIAREALRDPLADAAQPQDAGGLAAELGRQLRSALFPLAGTREALEAAEAAPRHQHQADGDVGDVVGQHVGCVRHLDAALAAVVDRNAVVADAEDRDDLELRQLVEQRRWRHRAAALHEAANARALRGEQPGLVARLVVIVAAVVALQRIVEEGGQRRGDDDVGVGHQGPGIRGQESGASAAARCRKRYGPF